MKWTKRLKIPTRWLERKISSQKLDDIEFTLDEFSGGRWHDYPYFRTYPQNTPARAAE
jgi:hypothetical protein